MTKCAVCGKEETLPFVCSYCGKPFCAEHRLPENHDCPGIYKARLPRVVEAPRPRMREVEVKRPPVRVSRVELRHLAVGTLVFFLIEASRFFFKSNLRSLVVILIGVVLAFAFHELAHKFAAQRYGFWAEFRLDPLGTILSAISIISPIKIVAPGAVLIFGYLITEEQVGKIALAGPVVNIVQAVIFFMLSAVAPILAFVAMLNADLALFNLIPVAMLDGKKVFDWSKGVWALAMVSTVIVWAVATFL